MTKPRFSTWLALAAIPLALAGCWGDDSSDTPIMFSPITFSASLSDIPTRSSACANSCQVSTGVYVIRSSSRLYPAAAGHQYAGS